MPLGNARHWFSPYEELGFRPHISVFVAQSAYDLVADHATSKPEYEVGGILVGNWHTDAETGQPFVIVETALPAHFTRQGSIYLTFTQDSLVALHAEMDEHFPGKQIVGWYHTHPGMAVFLSPYDTWLHRHFFPEPWQVALVIEPHTDVGGFFIRQADSTLDPGRYFGFYELDGNSGRSIVHWHNLQYESEAVE